MVNEMVSNVYFNLLIIKFFQRYYMNYNMHMILGEVILNLQTLVGLMIFYSKYGNDNTFKK
jgi:hypothetical protein